MTAALQHSFLLDGKRLDFSAEIFASGENPLDREVLTPEQIAALHKVVAEAQLMATSLSYESTAGLTGLLRGISGLRQALTGTKVMAIRAAASNLRDGLKSLKNTNPNNPQLTLALSALAGIVPEKTKTGQVIRLAVVSGGKLAQSVLAAKIAPESKTPGATIIPFNRAAMRRGQAAERPVPAAPPLFSRSGVAGKTALSVLAKPELKKEAAPAKQPAGKSGLVSAKTASPTPADKKPSAAALPAQKDNPVAEVKNALPPANAKTAASGAAKAEAGQAVVVKALLEAGGKVAEAKIIPANAIAADGTKVTIPAAVEEKAAQPQREARTEAAAVQAQSPQTATEPPGRSMEADIQTGNAAIHSAATGKASAAVVDVAVGKSQPNSSFVDATVRVAATGMVSVATPVAPQPFQMASLPAAAQQASILPSETKSETPRAVTAKAETRAETQKPRTAAQNESFRAETKTGAKTEIKTETLRAEVKIEAPYAGTPQAKAKSSAPLATDRAGKTIAEEFKITAKGACAGCGGGNCAACMRPMSADGQSVKSRFANLTKG